MKKTFLVPEYFLEFQCIGPKCDDTCCKSWGINIDKPTFKKYEAIASTKNEFGIKMKNSIKKFNRDATRNSYGRFNLNKSGKCNFLSDDLLCEVHAKLGSELLCETCKYYPRIYNVLNEYAEAHLTLSCPEAARKALLNEDGISFYEQEVSFFEKLPKSTYVINFDNSILEKYFYDIRIFTIRLLQNRNYSIEERLGILGIVFDFLETNKEKQFNLANVLDAYQNNIDNKLYKDLFKTLDTDSIKSAQLKHLVIAQRNLSTKVNKSNTPYFKEYINFLQGSKFIPQGEYSIDDIFDTYKNNTTNYYAPFTENHSYILENYLVDLVFKSKFPLNDTYTPFESYLNLTSYFSIIRTELIGLLGYYKDDLDINSIIYLIQGITTMVDHNKSFRKELMNSFIDSGLDNIPSLMLLFCY